MPKTYSAEELKQSHVDTLGQELGSLYHALWNELAWVESKWVEYVELYGTRESRIELLNRAAGHFFKIVQDSLWDDTLLHIARLTDPPKSAGRKSAGRENLTIRKLPLLLTNEELKTKILALIDVVDAKTAFCRDHRNRRLAHKDFALAMKTGVEPLIPASRAMIRGALDSISDVLNAISSHYMDSTIMFDSPISSSGAVSLLYVIDDGLRLEEERMERARSGKYHAKDSEARDL